MRQTHVNAVSCMTGGLLPVPERVPGDCYVWGSTEASTASKKGVAGRTSGWFHSTTPTLVDNTTHLDVCEVSILSDHHLTHGEA